MTSRTRSMIGGATLLLSAVIGGTSADAAFVQENFDYGGTGGNLNTFGTAGGGWDGAWFGDNGPDYVPGTNLTYDAPGYSNAGNGGGAAGYGGGDAGGISSRLVDDTLTGTIWVSALANITSNSGDAILWFRDDPHGANANFISLRGTVNGSTTPPVAVLRYGASTNTSSAGTFALDTTHLLLARITIDYDSGFDRIELWVDPDLTGGEAGLGVPLLSGEGASVFAGGVAGPRLSFAASGSAIDAVRISNDPDRFTRVTLVPEPASLGLVALGAGLMLSRRRRA